MRCGGREINLKGLLRANANKEVIAVKRAYYAVQNVASVFDDTLSRVRDSSFGTKDITLSFYEYRKEAGRDVPIVVGEIGRFMEAESARMNPIIASCAAETPMCACISSEGLLNQDKFHFDRASAEELGRRFYAAWKELAR